MISSIVVRFSIWNVDLPEGVAPDQYFELILRDLRLRETATEFTVEAGILDTLADRLSA